MFLTYPRSGGTSPAIPHGVTSIPYPSDCWETARQYILIPTVNKSLIEAALPMLLRTENKERPITILQPRDLPVNLISASHISESLHSFPWSGLSAARPNFYFTNFLAIYLIFRDRYWWINQLFNTDLIMLIKSLLFILSPAGSFHWVFL